MGRLLPSLTVALAVAVTAAGCGNGSEGTNGTQSTAAEPPTTTTSTTDATTKPKPKPKPTTTTTTSAPVDNQPNANTGKAPATWTTFARAAYEGEWFGCRHTSWSDLLFLAGVPEDTPYSRAALVNAATRMEATDGTYTGVLLATARQGCVDGFLKFVKSNRSAALR